MSGKTHRGRKRDRDRSLLLFDPRCLPTVDGDCLAAVCECSCHSPSKRAVDVDPPVVVDERDQLAGDDPQPAHGAPRPAARLTHPDPGSGANRHVHHDTRDNGQ